MCYPHRGVLIVSCDFELHWGVRNQYPVDHPFGKTILGGREAIPRMLDLLAEYGVAATWGTVGMLFAESKEELVSYFPAVKPRYANPKLNPYLEKVGNNEQEDPYHYAPSLIKLIASYPRQEIGSHTFSHYYCFGKWQNVEAFRNDMESAVKIASAHGYTLRSMIFPMANPPNTERNRYLRELHRLGIKCYRRANFLHTRSRFVFLDQTIRVLRFTDSFTGFHNTFRWEEIKCTEKDCGLIQVPGSMFLRIRPNNLPLYNQLHLRKIRNCMYDAARRKRVFHIWWHPHNFGADPKWSIRMLEGLLKYFSELRDAYGFESLNMIEAAQRRTDEQ